MSSEHKHTAKEQRAMFGELSDALNAILKAVVCSSRRAKILRDVARWISELPNSSVKEDSVMLGGENDGGSCHKKETNIESVSHRLQLAFQFCSTEEQLRNVMSKSGIGKHFFVSAIEAVCGESDGPVKECVARYYEIRNRIAIANIGMTAYACHLTGDKGIPEEDLMSVAFAHLLVYVEDYVAEKGFRFSTYATGGIRARLKRYIEDTVDVIRRPNNVHLLNGAISRIREKLIQSLHRNPTDEEIAREIGLPVQKVRQTIDSFNPVGSLSEEIFDGDGELCDMIEDPNAADPASTVDEGMRRSYIAGLFKRAGVSKRAERITSLRLGLDGEEPMTFEKIAQRYRISRARINEIYCGVLKKLSKVVERRDTNA